MIATEDPRAQQLLAAIQTGDLTGLRAALAEHPGLATARFESNDGLIRTALHLATDWPGHFPNGRATVETLVAAGADPNARCSGNHTETPLHWAASSNDVAVLDALIDAGADLEASGAVIAGGTPLMDAVAFGQWNAARRLVERGATADLWQSSALGLMERIEDFLAADPPSDHIDSAFWAACHGGQLSAAQRLLAAGADINWLPAWERMTPLDAARRSEAFEVLSWLHGLGAKSATKC